MNSDRVSKPNGIEIADLDMIKESVANAVERRNYNSQSKEFLTEISDEEAKLTKGGINATEEAKLTKGGINATDIFEPPITMGYIGHDIIYA